MGITIYKITEELLEEKGYNIEDSFDCQYSNNCKYLGEVLNAVGIDEIIFKKGNGYEFKEDSKKYVINLIEHHSAYKKLLKKHPDKREPLLLDKLSKNLQSLLSIEIEEENNLNKQLAIVEFMTHNKRKQFNNFIQSISVVSLSETLNPSDEIMLYSYYVEELSLLKEKFETVRLNMIEIRKEEVMMASWKDVERNKNFELYPAKKKLDRLVVKNLLNSKKKEDKLVRNFYKFMADRFSISETEIRNELRQFKEQGYQDHPYFELLSDKIEEGGEYIHPYEALQKALEMYEEALNDPALPEMSEDELRMLKAQVQQLGKFEFDDDDE